MQIFFRGTGGSDHASSTSSTSLTKYTAMRSLFDNYSAFINGTWFPGASYGDVTWITGHVLYHELGHLLTLSHPTRRSNGAFCSSTSATVCNDGCDDTPSPFQMVNDFGYDGSATAGINEPHCGWGMGGTFWCSNNLMDYSGSGALSPCQIDRMHTSLEGGLKSFRLCDRLTGTNSICAMGYPQISYYGGTVRIGDGCVDVPSLADEAVVYFSNVLEVEEIEIMDEASLEAISCEYCP